MSKTLFIFFITFTASVFGFQPHPTAECKHHGYDAFVDAKQMQDLLFETLARDLKTLDEKQQRFCQEHSSARTHEALDTERYKVITPLPAFAETDFDIKVKGRALYIRASNSQGEQYDEVRILPTFIDVASGSYTYEDGSLSVVFPISAATGACDVDTFLLLAELPSLAIPAFGKRFGTK